MRLYEVIYQVLEDVQSALLGMLKPEFEEVVTGEAEVREVFSIPRVGRVAGCYVRNGTITRGSRVRFLREGVVIWNGADRVAAALQGRRARGGVRASSAASGSRTTGPQAGRRDRDLRPAGDRAHTSSTGAPDSRRLATGEKVRSVSATLTNGRSPCRRASTRSSSSSGRVRSRGSVPRRPPSSVPPRACADLRIAEVVQLDMQLEDGSSDRVPGEGQRLVQVRGRRLTSPWTRPASSPAAVGLVRLPLQSPHPPFDSTRWPEDDNGLDARRGDELRPPRTGEPVVEGQARRDPADRRRDAAPVPDLGGGSRPPGPVATGDDRAWRWWPRAKGRVRELLDAAERFVAGAPDVELLALRDRLARDGGRVVVQRGSVRRYPRMVRVNEVVREVVADELERCRIHASGSSPSPASTSAPTSATRPSTTPRSIRDASSRSARAARRATASTSPVDRARPRTRRPSSRRRRTRRCALRRRTSAPRSVARSG